MITLRKHKIKSYVTPKRVDTWGCDLRSNVKCKMKGNGSGDRVVQCSTVASRVPERNQDDYATEKYAGSCIGDPSNLRDDELRPTVERNGQTHGDATCGRM